VRPLEPLESQVVSSAPKALQPVLLGLRDVVLSVHPSATIVAWPRQHIISFGVGPRKMTEHYAYIAAYTKHVNLGVYYGARLSCPGVVLEGTGTNLRHVKVRTADEAKQAPLRALVLLAFKERRVALKPAA
jgi:hypothetical protein